MAPPSIRPPHQSLRSAPPFSSDGRRMVSSHRAPVTHQVLTHAKRPWRKLQHCPSSMHDAWRCRRPRRSSQRRRRMPGAPPQWPRPIADQCVPPGAKARTGCTGASAIPSTETNRGAACAPRRGRAPGGPTAREPDCCENTCARAPASPKWRRGGAADEARRQRPSAGAASFLAHAPWGHPCVAGSRTTVQVHR